MVPSVSVGHRPSDRPMLPPAPPRHAARQPSSGTSISAAVSEPWRALGAARRCRPGRGRPWARRGRGRRRRGGRRPRPTGTPPSQPSSMICSRVRTQATSPCSAAAVAATVLGGTGPHVQPAEATLAADQGDVLHDLGPEHLDRAAHVDLAVVGGHDEHRPGREHVEHVADEAVDGAQLVVVVLARAPRRGRPCRCPRSRRKRTARPPAASARTAVTRPAGVCQRCSSTGPGAPR